MSSSFISAKEFSSTALQSNLYIACKFSACKWQVSCFFFLENLINCLVAVVVGLFVQGVVKPDIVFFGEDLPSKFYSMKVRDFSQCDLLLVLGTSLEVGSCFTMHYIVQACIYCRLGNVCWEECFILTFFDGEN